MQGSQPYKAFISYSHQDEKWASWLHRGLEAYRIPRRLIGQATDNGPVPKSLFPLFRDREELSTSHELGGEIQKALRNSTCLIVICSPAAAQSKWVDEEISFFKSLGRSKRIYCLIVDGEPNDLEQECFPPSIRFEVDADGELTDRPAEPIAADVRAGKDGKADAKLKLIAGLLGVGFNELKQRELTARNRRLSALLGLTTIVAATTVWLAYRADNAQQEAQAHRTIAETRQHQAEGLIQFMLGDLREKLEPIGKLDILDDIGQQAMEYFGEVKPGQLSDTELSAQAKALRQIGDVRVQQGKLASAEPVFRKALQLDEEILRRHPYDQQAIFNRGQSEFYIGYRYFYGSDWSGARPWFDRYELSARELVALDPDNPKWQQELSYGLQNSLGLAVRQQEYSRCIEIGQHARARAEARLRDRPDDSELLFSYSETLNTLSHCYLSQHQLPEALEAAAPQLAARRKIVNLQPGNYAYRKLLAMALTTSADLQTMNKEINAAVTDLSEAMGIFQELESIDPSNMEVQYYALDAGNKLLELRSSQGEFTAALADWDHQLARATVLLESDYNPLLSSRAALRLANDGLLLELVGLDRPKLQRSIALADTVLARIPADHLDENLAEVVETYCVLTRHGTSGPSSSPRSCPIPEPNPALDSFAQRLDSAIREAMAGVASSQSASLHWLGKQPEKTFYAKVLSSRWCAFSPISCKQ